MDAKATTLVSFATESHYDLQDELRNYSNLFDRILLYREADIDNEFKELYKELFSYKKYYGYFIWKPYSLIKAWMESDTPYILYVDSNLRFTNPKKFFNIYNNFDGDIFIPQYNHYINKDWTKRDTFIVMEADEPRYWNANQVWTVMIGLKKTGQVFELLKEYFRYCCDVRTVTELENVCGKENLDGYIAHRWEQSIMSILVEKYKIPCPLYNTFLDCVDKVYPQKILDLKKEVDANPLRKVDDDSR